MLLERLQNKNKKLLTTDNTISKFYYFLFHVNAEFCAKSKNKSNNVEKNGKL